MGIVVQHAHSTRVAPSTRTSQAIPSALDGLALSGLAKDPSARPQTARRLSHRLAEVADADPWTEENARLWWERYRFQS